MRSPAYLPLSWIESLEPQARKQGVSRVARSRAGFLSAYKATRGDSGRLSKFWRGKRDGFVARHMGQVKKNNEPLWTKDGHPTRRHLALIMWAYSPQPAKLQAYLQKHSSR